MQTLGKNPGESLGKLMVGIECKQSIKKYCPTHDQTCLLFSVANYAHVLSVVCMHALDRLRFYVGVASLWAAIVCFAQLEQSILMFSTRALQLDGRHAWICLPDF